VYPNPRILGLSSPRALQSGVLPAMRKEPS
jgi:hypothetical protein